MAHYLVKGEFMDVERTKSNIREVSLTAGMTSLVIDLIVILSELVLGVEHFVCMHDATTLLKVLQSFFVVTCIYVQDTSI